MSKCRLLRHSLNMKEVMGQGNGSIYSFMLKISLFITLHLKYNNSNFEACDIQVEKQNKIACCYDLDIQVSSVRASCQFNNQKSF